MIKELLAKLCCHHKWERIKDEHFNRRSWDKDVILLKCLKCGKIKTVYY